MNSFSPFLFGLFSYPPIEIAIDRMSKEETSSPFPFFCHMPFPCISFLFLYLFLLIFSFAFLFLSHFGAYLTIQSKKEISSPFPLSHFVWSSILLFFIYLFPFIASSIMWLIVSHTFKCTTWILPCVTLRVPCGVP